ncbi:MAG: SgcJ/EcaC family oxidoreductase [Gammaproteobacteria bacterium]|nr:SgcJ/EcaC family oxidoreductase [Gammaproteobacteria bacterium]
MNKLITTVFLMSLASVSWGQPEEKREAASVFQEFLLAYNQSDAEGIVNLFSEDAIFWGTGSKTLGEDTEEILQYFSQISQRPVGQRFASTKDLSILELSKDSILVSGVWQVAIEGQANDTFFRLSMAISLRDGLWKIVQFHNSRMPE